MVDDAVGEGSQGVPALGHNMTDSQVRLWQKVAGLEPTLAWLWIENHVGPYDAQRALTLGETMHDVSAKRQAAREEAQAEKRAPLFWRDFFEEEARVWVSYDFSEGSGALCHAAHCFSEDEVLAEAPWNAQPQAVWWRG